MTDFRLLGPVEVWSDGRSLPAGTTKQQAVLATLLLEAGRPVPVETLIDRVWGEAPPATARGTLQSHLSRIRRLLDGTGAELAHRSGAYRLCVEAGRIDLYRVRELTASARAAGLADPRRAELLGVAVEEWRGDPLSGLDSPWLSRMRETLRRQRLDLLADWAAVQLRLGDPDAVIDAVRAPAADNPLAEPLVLVLVRALAAAGRDAEALAVYEATRQRLAAELGADPSAELREAHRAVLSGRTAAAPARASRPLPAQLPADLGALFTGRTDQLARLDKTPPGGLVVVSGPAGVGKTVLAVRWAHQVVDRFGDGQLYKDLRGFSPGPPAAAGEVLRDFLTALGVAPDQVPAGLDALVGLYRSRLAGRRMLLVLDNAADADQVRPLLPGSAASMVVVTSRNQLPGLIATGAAVPLPLAEPSRLEARELLAGRLGADRVAAEPDAVDRIIAYCGRLPLALGVLAARAALRPDFPLAALAAELAETGGRLDALDLGDGATDIRAAFSWSYRALGPDAQRLYRAVGHHPGPDLSTAAASWLAGWPQARTRRALAELTRAYLLAEPAAGRYAGHDLLREHAAELAAQTDPPAEADAALRRLLDGYRSTAHAAAVLLDSHRDVLVEPSEAAGEPLADTAAALDWLSAEHANLLAAIRLCERRRLDTDAWHLAWCLYPLYHSRGHWVEQIDAQRLAVAAAERSGDLRREVYSRHAIASSEQRLGRLAAAREDFLRVIAMYERLDDPTSQARAHLALVYLNHVEHDFQQALDHAVRALACFESIGDARGTGRTLEAIGECRVHLGQPGQAVEPLRRAMEINRESGDRTGEAAASDSLGDAYAGTGDHERAIASYRRAVDLTVELGDRYHEALTRRHLGTAYRDAGRPADARTAWRHALTILDALGHPDAESLRADLRDT
jgi:DNA-binding SARP family transcriptional activator